MLKLPSARLGWPRRALAAFATIATVAALSACEKKPTDLREWTASDHTSSDTTDPERTGQSTGQPDPAAGEGLDEVTIATWSNNCIVCHGRIGRGDGPQSAMVKPRDLSDPAWQSSITDEQIATSIMRGKGLMPPFSALPQSTVTSLVHLIRRLSAAPQAAGSAAPATSANPAAASASAAAAPSPAHSAGASPNPALSAGSTPSVVKSTP